MNAQLENMFKQAKAAVADDLKVNFYNAAEKRQQAFRQLNNQANAQHAMFSGVPAGAQMQYDRDTFLPGVSTLAVQAFAKQKEMQENWDEVMQYIKDLNSQAAAYQKAANGLNPNKGSLADNQSLNQTQNENK